MVGLVHRALFLTVLLWSGWMSVTFIRVVVSSIPWLVFMAELGPVVQTHHFCLSPLPSMACGLCPARDIAGEAAVTTSIQVDVRFSCLSGASLGVELLGRK